MSLLKLACKMCVICLKQIAQNYENCAGNRDNLLFPTGNGGNIHTSNGRGTSLQEQGSALGLCYNVITHRFVIKQNNGPVVYPEDTEENALHSMALLKSLV